MANGASTNKGGKSTTNNKANGDFKKPLTPAEIKAAHDRGEITDEAYLPPPDTNRTGYFSGDGFWHDLGNYAVDALTGQPAIRAGEFAADGDWSNFGAQVGNMGGTPYGAHVFGQADGQPLIPNSGAFAPAPTRADSLGEFGGRAALGLVGAVSGGAAIKGVTNLANGGDKSGQGGGAGGILGDFGLGAPSEYALDPSQFDIGVDGFNESGDQAAFTYNEALDKSNRAYQAGGIRQPTAINAPQIRDINLGDAAQTTAAGPVPVERFNGAAIAETSVDPAAQAVFGGVGRSSFDTSGSDEIRADQLGDLQALRDAAAGRGPSASQDEYALALDKVVNEQMGAVNMARGADKAFAKQELVQNIGRQGMLAAHDAAALKAKEMQAATGLLGQQSTAVRGADVDVAGRIASLDQQANELDAQLRTAVAQGNRDAVNQLTQQKAQIASQRAIEQARNNQGAAGANAAAANETALDYSRRLDAATQGNADRIQKQTIAQGQATLNRDTAAGTQSIDAQKITNDQGVARDVSADNAGRAAFGAATDAQLGALNTANAATGQRTAAANGAADAKQAQYDLALRDKIAKEQRDAAERQSQRVLAASLLPAAGDAAKGIASGIGKVWNAVKGIWEEKKPATATSTSTYDASDDMTD